MYSIERQPVIKARTGWEKALDLPGSTQMTFMKNIFEHLQWQTMIYNPALILNDNPADESHIISAIGENKNFIVAYTPTGKPVKVDMSKLLSEKIKAYWYNPRSGAIKLISEFLTAGSHEFKPWSEGWGSDFLLILIDKDLPFNPSDLRN